MKQRMEELSKSEDTINKMLQKDKAENDELISEMRQRITTNDDRTFSNLQQTEKDLHKDMKKLTTQIRQIFSDAAVVENKVKKLQEKKAGLTEPEAEELVKVAMFRLRLELIQKIEANHDKFERHVAKLNYEKIQQLQGESKIDNDKVSGAVEEKEQKGMKANTPLNWS